jgi:NAD(P)-dependent dehydrogenase (short-subunit alcohol dehydrogenase family)
MDHTGLFSFNGRCGFVKGSTRGQGKAIALGLAQYGASPVQIDRDDPEKTTTRSRKWVRYDCLGLHSFSSMRHSC